VQLFPVDAPAGFAQSHGAETISAVRAEAEHRAAEDHREHRMANRIDTRFRIGSMNKMFTASRPCRWSRLAKSN
jgi:CubicO group peptidase (beta-lactamase class C family)